MKLVLVAGLPGTGKSTVARELAKRLPAARYSSDVERKKLFKERSYREKEKEAVYARLLKLAEASLGKGEDVVVDATFYRRALRDAAKSLAEEKGARFDVVETVCPEKIVRKRLRARRRSGGGASEANESVYGKVKRQWERLAESRKVDTGKNWRKEMSRVVGELNHAEIVHELGKRFEVEQTHISTVFLGEHNVYKVKKPVDFGFVDYSSREKRRRLCEKEVELNRRLCPAVYLGVKEVKKNAGHIHVGGPGETIDYAVEMRRLDAEKRMDKLLESNKVSEEQVREIARVLAAFHERARNGPELAGYGETSKLGEALGTAYQVKVLLAKEGLGKVFARAMAKAERFLEENMRLFRERAAQGRIRDGHGDVLGRNIFLEKKPVIFDCIEFNDAFRCIDVASEIAFLAMDLDFHGKEGLAEAFIDEYRKRSGDNGLEGVLPYYLTYRAMVGVFVDGKKAQDAGLSAGERGKALVRCKRYLRLAEKYVSRL